MITSKHIALIAVLATSLFSATQLTPTSWASESAMEAASMTAAAPLTVNVTDIDTNDGEILIGIFDTAENYEADKPIAEKIVKANEGTVSAKFNSLSSGTYAIKVLHDEDGDEEIDLSIIGAPSEEYGFSQNARDPFSQPEWEEAKFDLTASGYTANIKVK